MYEWDFNIENAPRGQTVTGVAKRVGKNVTAVDQFTPDMIIAAGNGGVVTVSHWIPAEGRWNRFTADTPPLAWMPWPTHPQGQE